MKKNFMLLVMLLVSTMIFSQKIIENPEYGINHIPGNITKIELTADATILHFYVKYPTGQWIFIPKGSYIQDVNGDEKLYVTKTTGIPLESRYTMTESGEVSYQLYFPKLSTNVKKVNFGEANEGGSWFVFDIDIKKETKTAILSKEIPEPVSKWIDAELKKVTKKPIANFNSPQFFNKTTGRLIGYIKGYDVRLGFKTGILYTANDITREDYPVVIEIHPDGRFEGDIPLTNPTDTYLVINKERVKFYIEPEQTVAMVLDWNQFLNAERIGSLSNNFKSITFKGPLAKINEDLLGYNSNPVDYNSFNKKIKTISPQAFKEEEAIEYKKNADNLATYLKNNSISDKATVLLKNKINLEHANHLFDFVSDRNYYSKEDPTNQVLKIPVENNYFDFVQDFDLNDQSLLAIGEFSTFVNRLEYSKPILIYPKSKKSYLTPEKTFDQYLEDEKIVVTENDKTLKEAQKKKTFDSYEAYQEFQKQFSEPYKNGWKAYTKKYIEPFNIPKPEKITMEKWQLRDSIVKNVFHLDKNLVYEIIKVRALDFDIQRSDSENAHQYWSELQKDITNQFLKQEGERIVEKQFPTNSFENKSLNDNLNNKVNIKATAFSNKLPEGKANDIFKNIINKHKGKILFIDFWATTCGPCVGMIKQMKETRKEYKDNANFEFVFVTDQNQSPIESYDKFVKEQELENIYRISTDDYNRLRQLFKFNGIPRYIVVDKKGEVVNDNFPMHNFDNLLDGILEKYK
ncbi:MAG: TlpA disulfide reductase family protein [Flavobacterium sp.]